MLDQKNGALKRVALIRANMVYVLKYIVLNK